VGEWVDEVADAGVEDAVVEVAQAAREEQAEGDVREPFVGAGPGCERGVGRSRARRV